MRIGGVLFILIFTSCAVGPRFSRPETPSLKNYDRKETKETVSADGHAQTFDQGASVPANWWRLFNAKKLDPLLTKALENSPSLQAALFTLTQSQYNLQAGYGAFFPQIDGSIQSTREKFSSASFGATFPSSIFSLFTLSGTLSYTLDIFGGARRALEGLIAQTEAERNAARAAYITLTGNLVNTVIAYSAYESEIETTRRMIQAQKEEAALTQAQVKANIAPYSNLLGIQSQLFATEASLPPLLQKYAQTEHLLATLSGITPAEFNPPDIALSDLSLPERLPKSLPSMLVRQRPDVLQAEEELHAASAAIGVATAALFPSITINAAYGANSFSGGPGGLQNFWNLGAGLTAPIFHGGELVARKKAAVAAFHAADAAYRQTVLSSFSQVADVLKALEHDAEQVKAQAQALASSKEAFTLIRAAYKAGTASYLQVLTADFQYLSAENAWIQATAQRLQDTVALFVALGGDWWNVKTPKSLASSHRT